MSAAQAKWPRSVTTALPVHGHIDHVDPAGLVSGWCAAVEPPFVPRRVTVLVNDKPAVSGVICDAFRKDLLAAGIGDGNHGFRVELPAGAMLPGSEVEVTLLDEATELLVGQKVAARWVARVALPLLEAHIDQVTPEGMIVGWCWDRANPERRVALNILVDGVVAGTTLAGLYRDDLHQAGKGSGHCGFSFFLPWQMVSSRGDMALALQDHETGVPVGQRLTLHRPQIVTAEQRIDVLERQLQLLRGELQAAEARAAQGENNRAAPELFRLVAQFFQDLADGKPRASLASLRTRLDDISERFLLIPFALPASPTVTLYVVPDSRIDRLHACLSAVHRAGADALARIVVLDPAVDEHDDAALIQAVARNIHVVRLRPSETLNDILLATPTPFLALVGAHVEPGPNWLPGLLADIGSAPGIVLAAACLEAPPGAATASRLVIDANGNLQVPPDDGSRASGGPPLPADAVDDLALLLRVDALRDAGGLDMSYGGLHAQILELCLRLRRRGHGLAYRGAMLGATSDQGASLLDQTSAADMERLRHAAAAIREREAGSTKRKAKGVVRSMHSRDTPGPRRAGPGPHY